jgi:hypothetical protein
MVTAGSFVAAVENPNNFPRSRLVGAWLGLTAKRYQSGEVDYDGHISRRGDSHLRSLLYEAATVILARAHADSELRRWGLKLREKIGFKRAAAAVARKLSVIMHTMLKSGKLFDRSPGGRSPTGRAYATLSRRRCPRNGEGRLADTVGRSRQVPSSAGRMRDAPCSERPIGR